MTTQTDTRNARNYWKELTDQELKSFYQDEQNKAIGQYKGLTFEEYLIRSARDAEWCRIHDC